MKRLIDVIKTEISIVILAIITLIVLARSFFVSRSRPMLIAASVGFVLVALVALIKNRSIYGIFILIALIFCWFGDFLGPYDFKLGLVAFAIAHLVFITAFLVHGINKKRFLAALGILFLSGVVILYWLYPYIPASDKIFVLGYVVIITAMAALGLGTRPGMSHIFISLGAVIFYISDIFVARWRFVDKSSINAFFCYPLYYTSCLILAFSILAYKKKA